ncbi:polysaccharide deacetylase [Sorangium cellulosum]|uniref:Polysaccharide deacetylase n=1 Tax=Sorangium cellulosum TaxID=56 RepID=A0A2L0ESC3_SORCE|nr:polysaccharide deacetylase family protein [Sorangium cellulosum]AUX42185.1 polysaccharide deacetylase [Sorangium cellulosum]
MRGRLAAVSVDLDEIPNYFAIHGLAVPERSGAAGALSAVYDVALPRIAAFAVSHGIPVTLFAIGQDLARPESAAALRALSDAGHAVENHSYWHRYDLSRLPRAAIAEDVLLGAEAIAEAVGRRPTGFRAPGYTVSDALFDALDAVGVAFDSSVFPCPPYYAAKALAMGVQRAQGRGSAAILDTPRVLAAPRRPYRPGRPWYRRGGRRFVELPIQVTPGPRLPVIGTSVALAGATGARWLARACAGEVFVNLELHGMDFLDRSDGLEALAPVQPELRVALGRRMEALGAFVEEVARGGARFVRLDEASRERGLIV